jgi:hypothetical protein
VTLLKAAGCSIAQGFLFGVPNREAKLAGIGGHVSNGENTGGSAVSAGRAG